MNNYNFDLESLLCCPFCKSSVKKTQETFNNFFYCEKCDTKYPIKDNIYYFNVVNSHEKDLTIFKSNLVKKSRRFNELSPILAQKIDTKEIIEIGAPLKGKILLDGGCGTGLSTIDLLKKDVNIIFIDTIPEALQIVHSLIIKKGIQGKFLLIVGTITNLPLKKKSVDIIWSGGVLEHIQIFKKPYIEFYRVLKNQGDLLFTIPNKFGLHRFLASIKERIFKTSENHYERGFIYYQLNKLFPKKYFSSYRINVSGTVQTWYNYIIIPLLKINLPYFTFLFYKYLIQFISKIFTPIKLSASWFRLHGKKV